MKKLIAVVILLIASCFIPRREVRFYDGGCETCDSTKYECKDLRNLRR